MQCSSSGCGSGCHSPACPCPAEGNPAFDSLEKVLACYWQRHADLDVERGYYAGLASLAEALAEAAAALDDLNDPYTPGPPTIPAASLQLAEAALTAAQPALADCVSFEELLALIDAGLGALPGLTPETVYLTALRIGFYRGLEPGRVLLDAAVREGAGACTELAAEQTDLDPGTLPGPFAALSVADIQGCLGRCRHQLAWLRANGRLG